MAKPQSVEDVIVRFQIDPATGCWLWSGYVNPRGYGEVSIAQKNYRVHRVFYTFHVGPIPDGLTLDHLCRVKHCVNPDHLEAVTAAENTLRGNSLGAINKRKTHCKYGHELAPIEPNKTRRCFICNKRLDKEFKERLKLKRAKDRAAMDREGESNG